MQIESIALGQKCKSLSKFTITTLPAEYEAFLKQSELTTGRDLIPKVRTHELGEFSMIPIRIPA